MRVLVALTRWHLRRAPGRAAAIAGSIALGVMLAVCLRPVIELARRTLTRAVELEAGRTQLEIVATNAARLPEALLERVRATDGVRIAEGVIVGHVRLGGRGGASLTVVGVDLLAAVTGELHPALGPAAHSITLGFVGRRDSIALGAELARRLAVRVGDVIEGTTAVGRRPFVVRSILAGGDAAEVAVMDLPAAQLAFFAAERLDRIDVALEADRDVAVVAAELSRVAGDGALVRVPAARGQEVERMLASFRLLASFLGLLSLAAAGFLVFSVTSLAVAQRRAEVAMLRAVGTSRAQVLVMIVAEAALLGAVGAGLGVVAGRSASVAIDLALSRLVEGVLLTPVAGSPAASPPGGMEAVLGVLAAVVAATVAAWGVTRESLGDRWRTDGGADGVHSRVGRRVGALACAALAAASVAAQGRAAVFGVGGLADVAIVLAVFLLAPDMLRSVPRVCLGPAARLGAPAVLAARNLALLADRFAAPLTTLVIGLHLLVTVGAVVRSFDRSVLDWLEALRGVDVAVTSAGSITTFDAAPIDASLGAELAALPDVAAVRPYREVSIRLHDVDGVRVRAWAMNGESEDLARYTFVAGDAAAAVAAVRAGDGALVSQGFSARFGARLGDAIALDAARGRLSVRVAGIVVDYGSPIGTIVVSRRRYLEWWDDPLVDGFAVRVRAGADPTGVREAILGHFADRFDLLVTTPGEALDEIRTLIRQAFHPLRAIEVVTLALTLVSLLNAFLIAVAERVPWIGMLRACGAERAQVAAMVALESLVVCVIGAGIAAVTGAAGSWAWVAVHVPAATGWIVRWAYPTGPTGLAVASALGLGALAAIVPARRATRVTIVRAIRWE